MTASQGVYDPWCDQDADGDIDIFDIVPAASAYGTTGDPTKEVMVRGFGDVVTVVENLTLSWTTDDDWSGSLNEYFAIPTNGYSRMQMYMHVANCTLPGGTPNYARVNAWPEETCEYGDLGGVYGSAYLTWNKYYSPGQTLFTALPSPNGTMGEIDAPLIRVAVAGSAYTPNATGRPPSISCLVSIQIYFAGPFGNPTETVDVAVTNWEAHHQAQTYYPNITWSSYGAIESFHVYCKGYSRLFVYATVDSALFGAYNVTVTMYAIHWAPGGVPSYREDTSGYLTFTADISGSGIFVPLQTVDDSQAIMVKASSCYLYFQITSNVPSGWITLRVTPYLRNE
jgi:hypothetical protein